MDIAIADKEWDAIVVGAGPAGALAARQLAVHGCKTLLVEQKSWPRNKVCGGCVNRRAIRTLQRLNLGGIVSSDVSLELQRFKVSSGSRSATMSLSLGRVMARKDLDARLVTAAEKTGVTFLSNTVCSVDKCNADGHRRNCLLAQNGQASVAVNAKIVLVASGLGAALRHLLPGTMVTKPASHIGLGTQLSVATAAYEEGTIYMAVGPKGYVGVVRLPGGHINIAAAVNPAFVRALHSPAAVVESLLLKGGLPSIHDLVSCSWSGTGPLTRHVTYPAAHRLLMLGDAAGYIEPFTGEGIAWALEQGNAASAIALEGMESWDRRVEKAWIETRRKIIDRRQRWCRALAWLLRHPPLVRSILGMMSVFPATGSLIAARISGGRELGLNRLGELDPIGDPDLP